LKNKGQYDIVYSFVVVVVGVVDSIFRLFEPVLARDTSADDGAGGYPLANASTTGCRYVSVI